MREDPLTRRRFLRSGVATAGALSAASYARASGANERVGLGFIGYGQIGKRHLDDAKAEKELNLVAVAETHRGRRDEAVTSLERALHAYPEYAYAGTLLTLLLSGETVDVGGVSHYGDFVFNDLLARFGEITTVTFANE